MPGAGAMYTFKHMTLLLAAGSFQHILAHTTFTNFYVDGANQGDGVAVRMNKDPSKATFPIKSITSNDMACGKSQKSTSLLVYSN